MWSLEMLPASSKITRLGTNPTEQTRMIDEQLGNYTDQKYRGDYRGHLLPER
jgi:hypothetical protein